MLKVSQIKEFSIQGYILFMLGSYAPFHEGHNDAITSAERAFVAAGYTLGGVVIAPHSDLYVSYKIHNSTWNINRRITSIVNANINCVSPLYLDDISCYQPAKDNVTQIVINTLKKLGITTHRIAIVVGADNLASMAPHIATHKVICVRRPGYDTSLSILQMNENFIKNASNLIIADRQKVKKDISSTTIRAGGSLSD